MQRQNQGDGNSASGGRSEGSIGKEDESEGSKKTFEKLIANCIALFSLTYEEALVTTLTKYKILEKAYNLKRLNIERDMYMQALANRNVKATNKKGDKYVVSELDDIFDYSKGYDAIFNPDKVKKTTKTDRFKLIQQRLAKLKASGREV